MESGLNRLDELQGRLGESHEDGRELDELDGQLSEWWSLCYVIRELEFTFRVDICKVSYPHYIDRVNGTKVGPLVVIVMISDDLFTNTDFRKRFSKLIWDINLKPDVFEVKWGLLMKEFNLEDTRWFKDMFTIRDSWIPGYFCDIPMCGLMKTTSRSESMNSFFNTYSESGNLLLNFMMNYNTAIQKQRNTQRELDKASKEA
ncbi:unnamed protein product [Lactuca saligna]|uniref:Protein FAR1-RELATED SEQUENCE n=1 Tax=Lactuca saligna TaxID=75948 RepID=A0AA36E391_LACSI|nr:unnamed protein product [Lactuca saligna]